MKRNHLARALTAALFLAGGAAAAEAPRNTWFRVSTLTFQCKGLHARVNHPQSVIATHTFDRGDSGSIGRCEALCLTTPGCVAYNFSRKVDTATSPPSVAAQCQLLNNANRRIDTTEDGVGEFSMVCYRGFPIDRYDTADYEWGAPRSFQDSNRPGAPGNGSPGSRYKP